MAEKNKKVKKRAPQGVNPFALADEEIPEDYKAAQALAEDPDEAPQGINPFALADEEIPEDYKAAQALADEEEEEEDDADPAASEAADPEKEEPVIPEDLDGKVIPFYKPESGVYNQDTFFVYGMAVGVLVGAVLMYAFDSKLLLCIATFLGMLIGYFIKKPEKYQSHNAQNEKAAPDKEKKN